MLSIGFHFRLGEEQLLYLTQQPYLINIEHVDDILVISYFFPVGPV